MHRSPRSSDHLTVSRGAYSHHGIYFGDGWVAHFSGVRPRKAEGRIQFARIEEFASPSPISAIEIVEYASCSAESDVLARAHSKIGTGGYNGFDNNCEHFARWCKTGDHASAQVSAATAAGGGVAGGATATAAAVGIVSAAGAAAGLSGAGVLAGLASVGSVVGGGATAGVAILAAAPALIATVATRRAFRDDAALPEQERGARRVARGSTLAAAAVGTAGSIAAISAAGTVAGLSGAGIASGLAAIGGTMVGGVVVAVAAPALIAGAIGYFAYRVARGRPR